ncbi:hypothetical protein BS50DRAFT_627937 [Corynespora cassiicola Philippines]|uniref:NmrA-like domain-containing protein n=1 Tax=Corynespora cassiicola Philippines TaxID=1448308 RepID=A0A2T2PB97_CORCC|nr:hypothetical protein BS50DRAFT_627937 [Corynespora cassiicola Philippines]
MHISAPIKLLTDSHSMILLIVIYFNMAFKTIALCGANGQIGTCILRARLKIKIFVAVRVIVPLETPHPDEVIACPERAPEELGPSAATKSAFLVDLWFLAKGFQGRGWFWRPGGTDA